MVLELRMYWELVWWFVNSLLVVIRWFPAFTFRDSSCELVTWVMSHGALLSGSCVGMWWVVGLGFAGFITLHALGLVYEFQDKRNCVLVLYSHCIQGPVVLYQLKGPILPFNEEDWGGHQRLGWPDASSLEVLLQEHIQLILLFGQ